MQKRKEKPYFKFTSKGYTLIDKLELLNLFF